VCSIPRIPDFAPGLDARAPKCKVNGFGQYLVNTGKILPDGHDGCVFLISEPCFETDLPKSGAGDKGFGRMTCAQAPRRL
jgi:hypothetical protein